MMVLSFEMVLAVSGTVPFHVQVLSCPRQGSHLLLELRYSSVQQITGTKIVGPRLQNRTQHRDQGSKIGPQICRNSHMGVIEYFWGGQMSKRLPACWEQSPYDTPVLAYTTMNFTWNKTPFFRGTLGVYEEL